VNKRGHVVNAVLLSVGIGAILHPELNRGTLLSVIEVGVPVTLGALLPDVDTAFGRHRKTLHNLPLLAAVVAFPFYFDNLHFVWIGVLTHYVLDTLGTRRGIALLYPVWAREFGAPTGVPVDSRWAPLVVLLVTAVELGVVALVVYELPAVAVEYGRQTLAPG
jgi:hypothetical protein